MNVAEVLRRRAEQFRDDAAILDVHRGGPRRLTFGELEQAAGRTAALLREAGLRCGDTALVMHAMSAELYVATAAIFRLGLVAMFVDPSAGLRFIERCCRLRPPRCVLGAARAHLLAWLSPSLRRVPVKLSTGIRIPGTVALRSAERLKDDAGVLPCEPETPALISFTSGSGGQPKAMLRTHGFLLAQHRVLERALELRRGEVELATLPIFVLANLGSGVTSVLPDADLRRPDAIDAAPVIAQIRQHAASRVAASPALLERLADYCERRRALLPNVRKWLTGGGPVSPRLLARLQSLAPQSHVTLVYGATEVEAIGERCRREAGCWLGAPSPPCSCGSSGTSGDDRSVR
jgi:acyl-CoA synthetase (AMP-forming)/AMP-acid ligase II